MAGMQCFDDTPCMCWCFMVSEKACFVLGGSAKHSYAGPSTLHSDARVYGSTFCLKPAVAACGATISSTAAQLT